jgi:hypothetical protein
VLLLRDKYSSNNTVETSERFAAYCLSVGDYGATVASKTDNRGVLPREAAGIEFAAEEKR